MTDRGSTRRGVRIVVVRGSGRKSAAGRLDYVDRVIPLHVDDIARAHLLALDRLASGDEAERFPVFNLGSGRACSAREVIDAIGEVAGRPLPVKIGPRRPGDVAETVADNALARTVLGWTPRFGLRDIVAHALAWERKAYSQEADNHDSGFAEVAGRKVGRDA